MNNLDNGPGPEVFIVVLNWNGWQDTLECLESLQQLNGTNYRVVLIDNGSTDNSIEQVEAWANGDVPVASSFVGYQENTKPLQIVMYDREQAENGGVADEDLRLEGNTESGTLVLIRNETNVGFAAGANIGIRYAMRQGATYVWLLNNDTVVQPDSLEKMIRGLAISPESVAATGQIRYYDEPERIWNCGGMVTWFATRKYYYPNKDIRDVPQFGVKTISFATGCSLLIKSSFIRDRGLLSERFFFGEEDFEFALRMSRTDKKAICAYESIVYHKVGRSIDTTSSEVLMGKIYISYLNRFLNMKEYWSKPVWLTWRVAYFCYIIPMLKIRYRLPAGATSKIVRALMRDSTKLDVVDATKFQDALNGNFG